MQLIWRTMDLVMKGLSNENEILFPEILLFLKQAFEISRKISYLEIEVGFVFDNMIVLLNWYYRAPLLGKEATSKRRLLLVYLGLKGEPKAEIKTEVPAGKRGHTEGAEPSRTSGRNN